MVVVGEVEGWRMDCPELGLTGEEGVMGTDNPVNDTEEVEVEAWGTW